MEEENDFGSESDFGDFEDANFGEFEDAQPVDESQPALESHESPPAQQPATHHEPTQAAAQPAPGYEGVPEAINSWQSETSQFASNIEQLLSKWAAIHPQAKTTNTTPYASNASTVSVPQYDIIAMLEMYQEKTGENLGESGIQRFPDTTVDLYEQECNKRILNAMGIDEHEMWSQSYTQHDIYVNQHHHTTQSKIVGDTWTDWPAVWRHMFTTTATQAHTPRANTPTTTPRQHYNTPHTPSSNLQPVNHPQSGAKHHEQPGCRSSDHATPDQYYTTVPNLPSEANQQGSTSAWAAGSVTSNEQQRDSGAQLADQQAPLPTGGRGSGIQEAGSTIDSISREDGNALARGSVGTVDNMGAALDKQDAIGGGPGAVALGGFGRQLTQGEVAKGGVSVDGSGVPAPLSGGSIGQNVGGIEWGEVSGDDVFDDFVEAQEGGGGLVTQETASGSGGVGLSVGELGEGQVQVCEYNMDDLLEQVQSKAVVESGWGSKVQEQWGKSNEQYDEGDFGNFEDGQGSGEGSGEVPVAGHDVGVRSAQHEPGAVHNSGLETGEQTTTEGGNMQVLQQEQQLQEQQQQQQQQQQGLEFAGVDFMQDGVQVQNESSGQSQVQCQHVDDEYDEFGEFEGGPQEQVTESTVTLETPQYGDGEAGSDAMVHAEQQAKGLSSTGQGVDAGTEGDMGKLAKQKAVDECIANLPVYAYVYAMDTVPDQYAYTNS